VASVAPPASVAASAAAAIRDSMLIRGILMTAFPPSLMLLPPHRSPDETNQAGPNHCG
jgi:hypothetical protein